MNLLLLATVLLQGKTVAAPVMPPGAHSNFHQAILEAEERLSKSDFSGAASWLSMLPGDTITYSVDLSRVPAGMRTSFSTEIDQAARAWQSKAKVFSMQRVSTKGHIRIFFTNSVSRDPTTQNARSVVLMPGLDPASPYMESGIALNWETGAATEQDVYNASAKVFGEYLGMCSMPFEIFSTGPRQISSTSRVIISDTEASIVRACWEAADKVRKATKAKNKMTPSRPRLGLDTESIEMGKLFVGNIVPFGFGVTNEGDAPLKVALRPDCGCLTTLPRLEVEPGRTGLATGSMDTTPVKGDFSHTIMIFSNDPERPMIQLPIRAVVKIPHRILRKEENFFIVPKSGVDAEAVVVPDAEYPFKLLDGELIGVPSKVTGTPFEGEYMGEVVKGYKLKIHIDGNLALRRIGTQIRIGRQSPTGERMNPIIWDVRVQQGIVADPESVNLGSLESGMESSLFVDRPYTKFAVTKLEVNDPNFTLKSEPTKLEGRFKITLKYRGGSPLGNWRGTLKIHTDDAGQPVVTVPLEATFIR